MTGPLDIQAIIERLRLTTSGFLAIEGAAAAASARDGRTSRLPAAFVYLERESSGGNRVGTSEAHVQRVLAQFAVLIAVRSYRDERGRDAMETIAQLCREVRSSLAGWKPDLALNAIDFQSGDLLAYGDATAWWRESFVVEYLMRLP